ncbi:MAG: PQQ-binding-like beta-propeller repeat protein [Deltaproteobacteria bacterium]|nr:PQQ-binding-like beta-propeller repeat protein [Deltaproteobacteria bacterium]
MLYFECDQPTPKWTWDSSTDSFAYGSDDHNWSMSSVAFSAEGDDILLVANDKDYYEPRQHVLQFRRDNNVPIRRLEFTSRIPISAAISSDGSRIAVITRQENPDDLDGDGYSVDTSLDYVHSRVMPYENGTLNWSTWLRHECTDCVITTYPWSVEVAISSNGSTVVASGPGGKVISYDASTGAENWSHTVTFEDWSGDTIPDIIQNLRVSDNGKKVVISSAKYGVMYFDADGSSGELQWRMKDKMLPYLDLLEDDNPEPNGFELLHEEDFVGLDEDELSSLALDLWPDVSMSNDGNVLLMTGAIDTNQYDQGYGHIYALYYGSPLSFQIISENETNHDSDFIVNAISGNGAYMAAIAWDTDESKGNSEPVPRASLHTFEIPPGLIADVTTSATLTITSNDVIMDELDEFAGSGDITVGRHIVKPGHGATLVEDHTLVDQLGLMTLEQCIMLEICPGIF